MSNGTKILSPGHLPHRQAINGHRYPSGVRSTLRSMSNYNHHQPLITDFLPTVKSPVSSSSSSSDGKSSGRTSSRIADKKKSQESEELRKKCISSGIDPSGFVIKFFGSAKGRGVVTKKHIKKGDFICEYSGDLISVKEAKKREKSYEDDGSGCYMYYFEWKNEKYCIDATIDPSNKRLGRLINHSRKSPNCKTRIFELDGDPHLIFVAMKNIEPGSELLYDYGETDRHTIEANPWLASS